MKDEPTARRFPQKQNISADLVIYIKNQILSGELNPGDRIVETKLAKELGISQTPVREALRQLQGEGIITVVPNKGPLVSSLQMNDAFEIYSIRSMLEGLAIRLAIQNATQQDIDELERIYERMKNKLDDESVPVKPVLEDSFLIHNTIIKLSRHSRLISMYSSIAFQITLINRFLGNRSSKLKEYEQHRELIDAVRDRDPDKAESVIRRHIYRSYRDFVEVSAQKEARFEYGENVWLKQQ